jgi:hypothetical protein
MAVASDDAVGLALYDREDRMRVNLTITENALPVIGVLRENGNAGISISISDLSVLPHLCIHDKHGNPQFDLMVDAEGNPHIHRYRTRWSRWWRALSRLFS